MPQTTPHIETRPASRLSRRIVGSAAVVAAALAAAASASTTAQAAPITAAQSGYAPASLGVSVASPYVRPYGNLVDRQKPSRVLRVSYRINGGLAAITNTVPAANGLFTTAWKLPYGKWTVSVNLIDGKTNPLVGAKTVIVADPVTRNPRGTTVFAQTGNVIRMQGLAFDPDTLRRGTPVYFFDNGRHVLTSVSIDGTYRWARNMALTPGLHLIRVVLPNVAAGTTSPIIFSRWVTVAPAVASWLSAYSGNQRIAAQLLAAYGWGPEQMAPLIALWNRESGWNPLAGNASGAYGIPQALPGSKMASAGADWRTNPATQIKWGFGYIKGRYGSPAAAWANSQATGWY